MDRAEQTKRIILAILLTALVAAGAWYALVHGPAEDRAARATGDYDRCFTEECKSEVLAAAVRRMS
jgi:hypothetical protein